MKSTFFGLQKFYRSMEIQEQARLLVWKSGFPAIVGFEYYPVISLPKKSEQAEEVLLRKSEFERQGLEIAQTDRGGEILLHSPGQLVIYPLVPLRKFNLNEQQHIDHLQQATVLWLNSLSIKAQVRGNVGVFTEKGKVASTGIRIENGISKHGISINISNDLELSKSFLPGGLTSLYEHQISMDLPEAFNRWNLYFTHELMAALPT